MTRTITFRPKVVVFGAGVSGVSTAIMLARAGAHVEVAAEHDWSAKTSSSSGACAIFLPLWSSAEGASTIDYPIRLERWARQSFFQFCQRVGRGYGIHWVDNEEFFLSEEEVPPNLTWITEVLPNFEQSYSDALPNEPTWEAQQRLGMDAAPAPYRYTWSFKTLVIDMPAYMPALLGELHALGGRVTTGVKLDSIDDLAAYAAGFDGIVNCTALGSKSLFGDQDLHGDKGILLLHEPLDIDHSFGADIFALIPRDDALVLGTHYLVPEEFLKTHPNRLPYSGLDPTDAEIETIFDSVVEIATDAGYRNRLDASQLSRSRVKDVVCRLRPKRDAGVRLELDEVAGLPLVHNYGHGGSGVCLSWGCGWDAAELLFKALGHGLPDVRQLVPLSAAMNRLRPRIRSDAPLYFERNGYSPRPETPIHRWFTIPESSDLAQIRAELDDLGAAEADLVIDPFAGSGTVGLAAQQVGLPFLGMDLLATCVIGSSGKLRAGLIESHHLVAARRVVDDLAYGWLFDNGSLYQIRGDTTTLPNLICELALTVREAIGNDDVTLAILSGWFGALSERHDRELVARLSHALRMAEEDTADPIAPDVRSRIEWSNSLVSSWGNPWPSRSRQRAIMLTSPTHLKTAQDKSVFAEQLEAAAVSVLRALGRRRPHPAFHPEHADRRVRAAVDHLAAIESPDRVRAYLFEVATILRKFHSIAAVGSRVLIECDNAKTDFGAVVEADLLIAQIAEELGYRVSEIPITHYVREYVQADGQAVKEAPIFQPTDLRGSFIYLESI
jgi:D-amino-acid oxidase